MPWFGEHSVLYRDKCLLCAPEGSLDLFLMLAYASIPFVGAVVAFPGAMVHVIAKVGLTRSFWRLLLVPFRNGSRSFSEFLTLARRGTAKLCIEDGLLAHQTGERPKTTLKYTTNYLKHSKNSC